MRGRRGRRGNGQGVCRDLESLLRGGRLEVAAFSEPFDVRPALLSIHAGAGGTESVIGPICYADVCPVAERPVSTPKFKTLSRAKKPGSAVVPYARGSHAYGYAKAERGVHRLVRISPLIQTKEGIILLDRRMMEDDDADIETDDDSHRYHRSSGKGGSMSSRPTQPSVSLTCPRISSQCQNERFSSRTSRPQCVVSSLGFARSSRTRRGRWKSYAKSGNGGETKFAVMSFNPTRWSRICVRVSKPRPFRP